MAKQAKTVKSTPKIYHGLLQDGMNLKRCLMEDHELNISMFDNVAQLEGLKSYDALIKPTIGYLWPNFDIFVENVNKQTLLTRHEQLFGEEPPKGQELMTTYLMVWHKLCSKVKTNMTVTGTPRDPVTQRKSTILTSTYSIGSVKEGTADIKTYQALKCLELFRGCLGDRESCTEAELKQHVLDNAGILKTRQDPWRIFQYYRPILIKANLLRRQ